MLFPLIYISSICNNVIHEVYRKHDFHNSYRYFSKASEYIHCSHERTYLSHTTTTEYL